ncbi:hypothetical protein C2G38_2027539 [Gigaspora rosea]|uniref:Helicase superfamily 3 single-stranded DNA/RNA virus domain-containing protein n=1 Tax=Gigaspora rosea TaxID=44941 RepID=A0A397W6G1_9GLOM|nr:hypothetical protein C2G38_2027539 [Gigaspora rosea]
MGGEQFLHNQAVTYYCFTCKEKFKCNVKKTNNKKEKEKREKQFKQSGTPECELCQLKNWCCSDKKCTNCCMLNKCNEIKCDYCKANNLECIRALPTTQEAFDKIKDKVSYIVDKYEPTESDIATWRRGEYPKEIVGPFEFGEYRELEGFKQNKKDINEYKADEYEGGIESNNKLLNENRTLLEIFKANKDKIPYCKSYEKMTRIYNDLQKEKKKKKGDRFWHPLTFYFYSLGGSGKSGLVTELFRNELYKKPKKQRNNWWNGYNEYEIVLLDEFFTKIEWRDMVNIMNDTAYPVEQKSKGFVPFVPKYIFLTARKAPNEAYNFSKRHDEKNSTQRDWGQFQRHLDYIIEFKGQWHDEIEKRITEIIFHKGDEQEFRSMI